QRDSRATCEALPVARGERLAVRAQLAVEARELHAADGRVDVRHRIAPADAVHVLRAGLQREVAHAARGRGDLLVRRHDGAPLAAGDVLDRVEAEAGDVAEAAHEAPARAAAERMGRVL